MRDALGDTLGDSPDSKLCFEVGCELFLKEGGSNFVVPVSNNGVPVGEIVGFSNTF